jgi:hypothetical protein
VDGILTLAGAYVVAYVVATLSVRLLARLGLIDRRRVDGTLPLGVPFDRRRRQGH